MRPQASVIIPVWQGEPYLRRCLEALLAQEGPSFEVLVVDNASPDAAAALVREQFPQVTLLRNARNLGFAGGCNVGLRAAQGEVLLLLNQDTEVQPGWLASLVETVQDPQVGIAGCRIFYPDGVTLQHAGAYLEWPLALAHHHGGGQPDGEPWQEARAVETVTGAALALRRAVWEEVGGLDEGFWPGYFEDMDLCLRVRAAGYQIWYQPQATLIHQESTSISDPILRSYYYQQGRLRLLLKHLEPSRFLNEFVPAERAYQGPAIFGMEGGALRQAYLKSIPAAISLLQERWQAAPETLRQVSDALHGLYRAAWDTSWQKVEAQVGPVQASLDEPLALEQFMSDEALERVLADFERHVALPVLESAPFDSPTPLVGPLLSGARRLGYELAARWPLEHLQGQQERVNRQQEGLNRQQALVNQHLRGVVDALDHMLQRQRGEIRALARQGEALRAQIQELAEEHTLLLREIEALRRADYPQETEESHEP